MSRIKRCLWHVRNGMESATQVLVEELAGDSVAGLCFGKVRVRHEPVIQPLEHQELRGNPCFEQPPVAVGGSAHRKISGSGKKHSGWKLRKPFAIQSRVDD